MLRLIDTQWHIGHQYEMLKFPFVEWTWLMQYQRPSLDLSIRGDIRSKFTLAPYYESGMYDAAILHLDQGCLTPLAWNRGKGSVYRDLNTVIQDIPKIVIMHGTPYLPEAPAPFNDPDYMRELIQTHVGSNTFIVNSRQAASDWGIGIPIIHGLDPNEWFDLPKLPRVITTLSASGMDSYYDRPFLASVKASLNKMDIVHCQIGVDYIPTDWRDYRTFLGQSLIYFNPTFASPMPRSRTEAMLSGCCVITTPHQDAASFIDHGNNGFLVNRDPEQVAGLIESLIKDPYRAASIGQEGKATAQRLFSWQRFATDWNSLLGRVVHRTRGING
jgi:glycosyltransferase involved in cell wall biosynthesis